MTRALSLTAAVVLATLVAAAAPAALAHHGCHTRKCNERVAAKRCSQTRVLPCIERAALRWRVSYRMLKRKSWCESRHNPWARNGVHIGLFQFNPGTFATTPYASRDPWRAKWNALAAGWMHHVGRGNEWVCA